MKTTMVRSLAFLSAVFVLGIIGLTQSTAQAAVPGQVGNAPRCTVASVGPRGQAFSVTGNTATVKFTATGPENCRVQVSALSFFAPSIDGRPYDQQILFERSTKTYSPGTHTLSVDLPKSSTEEKGCFYQVDLTYGTRIVSPVLAYGHGKLDCKKEQPAYECVSLTVEKISRTKYRFIANATASNGATIEKYEFGFGDGFGITVEEKSYTYEYKKTGTFETNVVVHVRVNGMIKEVTSPACEKNITVSEPKIRVCELATKQIITIDESQFDTRKHSKDLNDCKETPPPSMIQVCELATGDIKEIKESEFDASKHSKDLNACDDEPQVLPATISATGPGAIAGGIIGSSALSYGLISYLRSRRTLLNKMFDR